MVLHTYTHIYINVYKYTRLTTIIAQVNVLYRYNYFVYIHMF